MTTLDDLKQIKKLDNSNMANFIAEMPYQFSQAFHKSKKIKNKNYKNIKNIVIAGMGGSAIGGELIKTLVSNDLSIPIFINRDWHLPCLVNKNTLVIIVSYSGKTKETLSCCHDALKKKAKIFIITSGGKLEKLAKKENIPIFKFNFSAPPRASLGYLSIPILTYFQKLRLINLKKYNIKKSLEKLKKFNQKFYPKIPSKKNTAKYLAYLIFDHSPIIIVPEKFVAIARRWRTQMAENSKNFAFFDTLPEIFHNFIEARFPNRFKDEIILLFLENLGENSQIKKTTHIFQKLLDKENVQWEEISATGNNPFTKILSLVLLGDWVSFYLSMLNQIDPTPVKKIAWFKKQIH